VTCHLMVGDFSRASFYTLIRGGRGVGTRDESLSLLWLRQHSQREGSDRAVIVRYLEFLRYLVMSGKSEAEEMS